jgi:YfiH family protein
VPQELPRAPQRFVVDGVALETDRAAAGSGVTFCFSERLGGVSSLPYASLNLGCSTGDDPACVQENRRRLLGAMGAADLADTLVVPSQVHGDVVARIVDASAPVPAEVVQGCDAVVCTVPDVAVLLLVADCVPVVLVGSGGFVVVHSGWRGTKKRIAAKAARALSEELGCDPARLSAYIGPHIGTRSYEVSEDLAADFSAEFGERAVPQARHLDLSACIAQALEEEGLEPQRIVDCGLCTFEHVDRFFSHRAEHGVTGRNGALAFMRPTKRA